MVTRVIAPVMHAKRVEAAIGNVSYLLLPHVTNFLGGHTQLDSPLVPTTVITTNVNENVSKRSLEEFYRERLLKDDVFQLPFLQHILFYGARQDQVKLGEGSMSLLEQWGAKSVSFVASNATSAAHPPPPGPYVLGKGQTWEPWRVYIDVNSTLVTSFVPGRGGSSGILEELDSTLTSNQLRVVVPSRCYSVKSKEKPLAGARIVVKDNFDIEGFKTSICSKAWLEYQQPANKTAACIQRLLDQGAILLGKAKLQAWIMREEPLECVDFLAPFNPRGDGYQTASGSSNGSGAAMGSYAWLDFSVGSDTNGSGRKPAHWNGCPSVRPTHSALPMAGVTGFWGHFDAPVFYTRDTTLLRDFASAWYGDSSKLASTKTSKMPSKVILPQEYMLNLHKDQAKLVQAVAEAVAKVCGATKESPSLSKLWDSDRPDEKNHTTIEEYLELAGCVPYYYDAYYPYQAFYKAYTEKFDKTPFVNRYMKWRWEIHNKYTQEERDDFFNRLLVYKNWLLEKIFRQSGNDFAVMVVPIENGKPNYRDDLPLEFTLLNGFAPLNVSPVIGGPEVTVIAGEIPYYSRITNRTEPMPIGVSIIGPPGSDMLLCEIAKLASVEAKIPTIVATGRSIYTDGPRF